VRLAGRHDFHGIEHLLKRKRLDWVTDLLDAPHIPVGKGCGRRVSLHLREQLTLRGWSDETRIDPSLQITIFSAGDGFAFQVQTGNIGRAFYDLLKLQGLYLSRRIDGAIFVLPSGNAAASMGSNIANYDRVIGEMAYFNRVISVPMLVLAFE